MKTVDVDDDTFFYIQGVSDTRKMPIPQVIRERFLPAVNNSNGTIGPNTAIGKPVQGTTMQMSSRDTAICDFVQSPSFLANRSVVEQFLSILSYLHKQNPDKFGILESMEGRKRKYVARSEQELEGSGISVNPKKIPGTAFWVVTNNSTENKKRLLEQALTLLGYTPATIQVVIASLR